MRMMIGTVSFGGTLFSNTVTSLLDGFATTWTRLGLRILCWHQVTQSVASSPWHPAHIWKWAWKSKTQPASSENVWTCFMELLAWIQRDQHAHDISVEPEDLPRVRLVSSSPSSASFADEILLCRFVLAESSFLLHQISNFNSALGWFNKLNHLEVS